MAGLILAVTSLYGQDEIKKKDIELHLNSLANRMIIANSSTGVSPSSFDNLSWGYTFAVGAEKTLSTFGSTGLAVGFNYDYSSISSKKYVNLNSVVPRAPIVRDNYLVHRVGPFVRFHKFFKNLGNKSLSLDLYIPFKLHSKHRRQSFMPDNSSGPRIIDRDAGRELPLVNLNVGLKYSFKEISLNDQVITTSVVIRIDSARFRTDSLPIAYAGYDQGVTSNLLYLGLSFSFLL